MDTFEDDRLVDTHEAARLMGLQYNTLVKARIYGGAGACPYVRLGRRAIRYSTRAIAQHIAASIQTCTAQN